MDAMSLGDESDDEPMSTDMLKEFFDGSKYHPSINTREACYRIRDHIKQRRAECKGSLLFKAVVNEISQELPILGESGSEVSYFVLESIIFQK